MSGSARDRIREFIRGCVASRNDPGEIDDRESLFLSGRLDSLAVTRLVVFLEEQFAVDFGQAEFDVGLLDSVDQIEAFARSYGVAAAE